MICAFQADMLNQDIVEISIRYHHRREIAHCWVRRFLSANAKARMRKNFLIVKGVQDEERKFYPDKPYNIVGSSGA